MRRLTVILTVFNRDELTLVNTLRYLVSAIAGNPGIDVLVVDDGSTEDYTRVKRTFPSVRWERVDSVADAGAYNIDGHNNPAYANNRALEWAAGEDVLWLSSDCLVPPHLFERLGKWDLDRYVWTASVLNMRDAAQFCGPNRIFPACWCLASSRRVVDEAGGYDETYIKGMAFEDNDFTARLALATGKLVLDTRCVVFHQYHPPVAYSDDWEGFKRSEAYTRQKWGGIPWSRHSDDPVKMTRTDLGGCIRVDCERVAEKVVA